MLPNIHKTPCIPQLTYCLGKQVPCKRISQFIDFFLQSNVKTIHSFTTDFLNILQSIDTLTPDCILLTLDVSTKRDNKQYSSAYKTPAVAKEGMRNILGHFQQLRAYRDEIETCNLEEIPVSLQLVPRSRSVAEGP